MMKFSMLFAIGNAFGRVKSMTRSVAKFYENFSSSILDLVCVISSLEPCSNKAPSVVDSDSISTSELSSKRSPWLNGGNGYDDIRINLVAAYILQDLSGSSKGVKKGQRCWFVCKFSFYFDAVLQKAKLIEPLVMSGFVHSWFDRFEAYWRTVLGGRPLCLADFHSLRHSYRVKVQKDYDYDWGTSQKHLENWQLPHNIYSTFSYVYKAAIKPISGCSVFRYLKHDMRVLEFGCSLAPFYRNWKSYFGYIRSSWTLMDIANFPFHYARYLYMCDEAVVSMPVIAPENFDAPIEDGVIYDFIIVTTVFEHLHQPLTVAKHLVDHLSPGGFLVFDYVLSEAEELDTPGGLAERLTTLKFLYENLVLRRGSLDQMNKSVGLCICQKPMSRNCRG